MTLIAVERKLAEAHFDQLWESDELWEPELTPNDPYRAPALADRCTSLLYRYAYKIGLILNPNS